MKKISLVVGIICFLAFIASVNAGQGAEKSMPDLSTFSSIPVLDQGRIKPIDSFARIMLRRVAGDERAAGLDANQWLAECLFQPAIAAKRAVYTVRNKDLRNYLGLPERTPPRYTLVEISEHLEPHAETVIRLSQSEENLPKMQMGLLDLYTSAITHSTLLESLSLLLPLAIDLPEKFKKESKIDDENLDYLKLQDLHRLAEKDLERLIKIKGPDVSVFNEDEKKLASLVWQLRLMQESGLRSPLFRVIPVTWSGKDGEWVSPSSALMAGQASPETTLILKKWGDMARTWIAGDDTAFQKHSAEMAEKMRQFYPHTADLRLEKTFNFLHPFTMAGWFYAAFIVLCLLGMRFENRWTFQGASLGLLCGLIFHGFGIVARVMVLDRPPVGTLYESVLFVGFVLVFVAGVVALYRKNEALALCGVIPGLFLLLVSASLTGRGDTMEMLVAVLNTNFWLATHVLAVTSGYGVCVMAAMLAHIWLFSCAFPNAITARFHGVHDIMATMTLMALMLMATGTILGGIWADQSWGRFWGWDPKENGALLITLWLIWLLHGRYAGKLNPLRYTTGLALTNVIVALSWFGVNLLGTGLHSYGFVSGVATGLTLFCTVECSVIGYLFIRAKKSQKGAFHAV